MKFLSVRDLRGNSASVWRDLPREGEMIVTSNGRPVAMLTAIDESSVERSVAALRQVKALQAITDIQTESARKGTSTIAMRDIDAEIAAVRKKRHQSKR